MKKNRARKTATAQSGQGSASPHRAEDGRRTRHPCLPEMDVKVCGAAVVGLDYQFGEREFNKSFVSDGHRVGDRIKQLAV